ncbi:MAG: tetratricopeptide repeat protein [Candidatus Wallbacteria bacterium]|nr:tetratricopeptide repeat protein [Candidatus Wallbacteria bacterium]
MEFLKQIPIFHNLEEESLKKINDLIETKNFQKGKVLFYQGDPGDIFYIIKKGTVSVMKKIENEQQKVAELAEGDFFGEMALIEGEPRNATIICETECQLLAITKEKFDTLLKVNLSISLKIMKVMSQRFKERAAKTTTAGDQAPKEGKIVAVCSPRGGCGRSTIIANLATAIAKRGHSTVIVDYDLQFGDQALMFNLMHSNTIVDLIQNEKGFSAATVEKYLEKTGTDNLKILPAPHIPEEAELIPRQAAYEILANLKGKYQYVVVDTASYFSDVTLCAFDLADVLLLIADVDLIGIKNSRAALKLLENLNYATDKIKLMINKSGKNKAITTENITNSFGKPVYSELPYSSEACIASLNRGQPLFQLDPENGFSKVIDELAAKVCGEKKSEPGFMEKIMDSVKNVYGSANKWKKVKEMEPKYAGAYYNLGLAYKAKGMIDEAIQEYKDAIKLNPNYADCHYYLGQAYMEKGLFTEAADSFQSALKINQKYKEAKNLLGLAYLKGEQLDKAKIVLSELIAEFPHFADSMNYLGKTYFLLKDFKQATEMLEKAISINPKYLEARYNLANVYEASKDLKKAIEEYQRIVNEGTADSPYFMLAKERISVLYA